MKLCHADVACAYCDHLDSSSDEKWCLKNDAWKNSTRYNTSHARQILKNDLKYVNYSQFD